MRGVLGVQITATVQGERLQCYEMVKLYNRDAEKSSPTLKIGVLRNLGKALESRLCEMIALEQADAGIPEPAIFAGGFHPLRDDLNRKLFANLNDSSDDGLARTIDVDPPDQLHVQLDVVGLEFAQQIEAGVTCSEIVNCRAETKSAIFMNDA